MKKLGLRMCIALLVFSMFSSVCFAVSVEGSNLPPNTEKGYGSLDGVFPGIMQSDFDENFSNFSSLDSTLDLALVRGEGSATNVVGIVLDQSTEVSVKDVLVDIVSADSAEGVTISINTDENGKFHVKGLPEGNYHWNLSKMGYSGASYLNYDVYEGEGTVIFTFYISDTETINKDRTENQDLMNFSDEEKLPENTIDDSIAVASIPVGSTIVLNDFTVFYNNKIQTIDRYRYLAGVVASEALGYYQCTDTYSMTDEQIRHLYRAQGVASNTFLEYMAQHPKHSGYTVCSSANCQKYDSTKITTFITGALDDLFFRSGGNQFCYIIMYKPTSSTYDYVYGAYFQKCKGTTLTYGNSEPALKAVSCTNVDGSNSTLSGNGWGMCQYGAAYQAKQGKTWIQITQKYYSNCGLPYGQFY